MERRRRVQSYVEVRGASANHLDYEERAGAKSARRRRAHQQSKANDVAWRQGRCVNPSAKHARTKMARRRMALTAAFVIQIMQVMPLLKSYKLESHSHGTYIPQPYLLTNWCTLCCDQSLPPRRTTQRLFLLTFIAHWAQLKTAQNNVLRLQPSSRGDQEVGVGSKNDSADPSHS